jgi:hypothetical protein
MTRKQNVLKRYGLPDDSYSKQDLAKITQVPLKIIKEVYNRGIGAYETNPESVRLKGSFVKNVNAPMSQKLSKEQWAMARVYSFLDGNPKHDNDLRENRCPKCGRLVGGRLVGGVHVSPEAFYAWINKKWDGVLEQPQNRRKEKFREIFRVEFPESLKSPLVLVANNKNDTLEFTRWSNKKREEEVENGFWTVKLIKRAFTEINNPKSYYNNLPPLLFTGEERE